MYLLGGGQSQIIRFLLVKNSQHGQALIRSETWDKKEIIFSSGQ